MLISNGGHWYFFYECELSYIRSSQNCIDVRWLKGKNQTMLMRPVPTKWIDDLQPCCNVEQFECGRWQNLERENKV